MISITTLNSAIVDASLTNTIGKNMGKISAWYDNEWGFSCRMCDLAEYIHKKNLMKSIQIKGLDLNNKKILIRLDLNVPLNGANITDTNRIDKTIPTLQYLLEK